MITGLSHVSIVVPDIEAAAKTLAERYGLTTGARMVNAEQGVRLAYVELPGAKIELMEPSRPDSPVAKFLERNPKGGIHHFSLSVDSVDAAVGDLRGKGVRVLGDGKGAQRRGRPHRLPPSGGFPRRAGRAGRAQRLTARLRRLGYIQ